MKRNVVLLFVVYCAAVLIALKVPTTDAGIFILFILLLFGLCVFLFRKSIGFMVVLALCAMLGFLRAEYLNDAAMFVPEEFENYPVYVQGVVHEATAGADCNRYVIAPESMHVKTADGEVYGKVRAKIALTTYKNGFDAPLYAYGDRIKVQGTFHLPDTPDNAGEFNFGLWNKTDGIYGSIATKASLTRRIGTAKMPIVSRAIANLRAFCTETFRTYIGGEAGALLNGILLSERADMSDALEQDIALAGLSHICVVSGMHIAMLYSILLFLFTNLRIKRWIYYPICSVVLHLFALLAGGGASVSRAMLMFDFCMLAYFTRGDEDRLYTCLCTAFVMLLWNPLYLCSVGFLLSFACVFGILIFEKRMEQILTRFLHFRRLRSAVSVCLSAQLFTLPILAYHFYAVSPYTVLYNLLITWLVPLIMAGGILLLILAAFWQYGAGILGVGLRWFLQGICALIHTVRYLPFASLTVGVPHMVSCLAYYACVGVGYGLLFAKEVHAQMCARVLHACMLAMLVLNVLDHAFLKLHFINVGEGDSALLQTPAGVTVLVDGGGSPAYSDRNVGEETVEPYLRRKGVSSVDYAILSHYDKDHAQGMLYICETMRVKQLILPARHIDYENEYKTKLEACAAQRGIELIYVQNGDKLTLRDGLSIAVLSPDAEMLKKNLSENNLSLVFRLEYGETKILFTGDIEKLAENRLYKRYAPVDADILKVAHHGSDTSNALPFLQNVTPQYALVSAGEYTVFGHPAASTVRSLEMCGAEIYNTATMGDVTFYLQKSGIKRIN